MKSLLATLCLFASLALVASAASTQIRSTAAGYQLGTDATQKIAFLGADPLAQQSGTAQLALSDSTSGVIPSPVTITGTTALTVISQFVLASSSGATISVPGVLPNDVILSALSGTTSALADFTTPITGTNGIVQSGTTVAKPGAAIKVTIGRYPSAQYFVLVPVTSGTSAAAETNKNFATLAQSVNEIRAVLVRLGLIKGKP